MRTRKLKAPEQLNSGHEGHTQKHTERDFPGGPVLKNPPCNAGDTGSIPGQGTKIPHVVEQLKPVRLIQRVHAPQ